MSPAAPTHALLLTAGLGTRFRPLSASRAKAAVPIAGRPLVHHIIAWLESHGVRDLVLNLHHRPETITRELGDGAELGVRVRYSWEQPILGSAGGPRHALPLIEAPAFLIVNGDTLTDLDVADMWNAHVATGARVTMALIPNPKPMQYGGVVLDAARTIVRFSRPGAVMDSYHYIGTQIVSGSVFEPLADNVYAESVNQVYPALMAREPGAVRGYISAAAFQDVGTPADYLDTALRAARREGVAALSGRGTTVHASAAIVDSVLWDDVDVAAGCRLTRCVVGDGVRIPAGSVFEHCAIARGERDGLDVVKF